MKRSITMVALAVLLLGACGRKGPLELPAASAEAVEQAEKQEEKRNDTP